jgi:uncharacterized protein YegP (UPF0339 family)
MEPHDERHEPEKPDRNPHHRGTQHLRVGIEIRRESTRVVSIWVVDQPAVQFDRIRGPVFARVDVGTAPVLVEGFADPRVTRSTYREKVGHHFGVAPAGIVHVSVPFTDVRELAELRIRVIDATTAQPSGGDPKSVTGIFDSPPPSMHVIADVPAATLRHHPDWVKVAETIGLPVRPGCFEVYRAADGRYRWRLRRANGDVVAESAAAYPTREGCDADIGWVRANAEAIDVTGADSGSGSGPCGS